MALFLPEDGQVMQGLYRLRMMQAAMPFSNEERTLSY
jgi:hypothetical protein